MKLSKVAAVVAGSVAALGATSPAFAAEAQPVPMSLTSGLTAVTDSVNPVSAALPQTVGNGLAEQGESVQKVVTTVQEVNKVRNDAPAEVMNLANGATQASPLLGGVKLNGGAKH
ncbi:hypothetical protein ACFRJ1_32025 [Streptomyces sp. NPDC056773]|uniref:hypothetical protein n=1 Tax=unclassified Streptomyces TaxID=2593676 RepID=UPI0020B68DEA|nr:hypothetical protein [Streptomyces sp. TBY4]MCP3758813.1 hypothetical protein [Streptomyces sp. TBY4]